MLDLSTDDLLTTTRSVRRRLDLTRPVPREVIESCLELGLQAPNGSNLNAWRWIVIDDSARIREAAAIYNRGLDDFVRGLGKAVGENYAGAEVPATKKLRPRSIRYAKTWIVARPYWFRFCPGVWKGWMRSSRPASGAPSSRPSGVSCWHCVPVDWEVHGPRGIYCARPKWQNFLASQPISTPKWDCFRSPTRWESTSDPPTANPWPRCWAGTASPASHLLSD